MTTLGAPGFAITNFHGLANWSNTKDSNLNFSDIKYARFDTEAPVRNFTSFSDYVNSTRKLIEYNKKLSQGTSTGFLLTNRDIGLMSLEFSFGEAYIAPKLVINCLDPNNSFESNVLTDFLTLAKNGDKNNEQYYIAFGHGDNLAYWTNFLTFRLVGIRRTNNPMTSDQVTLEFIPGAGVTDANNETLINSLKELQFKNGPGSVVAPKIMLYEEMYDTSSRWFNTTLYTPEEDFITNGELKLKSEKFLFYESSDNVIKAIFSIFKYQLKSILKSTFADSNVILAFSDAAIIAKLKELTENKKTFSLADINLGIANDAKDSFITAVSDTVKSVIREGKQAIDKNYVLTIIEALNCPDFTTQLTLGSDLIASKPIEINVPYPVVTDPSLSYIGASYKHYIKLELKVNKIVSYLEFLKQHLSTLNGESTEDLVLYRELDSTMLSIWEKYGVIEDSRKPCIIFGNKLEIQTNLYGNPIGGDTPKELKASDIARDIRKYNMFDLSIYGMADNLSSRKIEAQLKSGIEKLIKYNHFPIFKFNQQSGNVSNLSIEDNMLYFATFNKTIKLLRNYSGAKTRLEADITIPTYYKQKLVGNITYKATDGTSRTLDLSEDKISELNTLKEAYLKFIENNVDSKFVEFLKVGDLSSARDLFRKSILDNNFNLTGYQDTNTLDILFTLIFEKLQKDAALIYYVEHELKNDAFALEYDLFNNINKQMFKIDITTLPMFKLCNFSFIGIPCVFLYDELPIVGINTSHRDFLSGLYIITGIKHSMTSSDISSSFILRKHFSGNYGNL